MEREVAGLLTRSAGRPSYKPVVRYKSFQYLAASWEMARRVVAKAEFTVESCFLACASSLRPWKWIVGRLCDSRISAARRSNGFVAASVSGKEAEGSGI